MKLLTIQQTLLAQMIDSIRIDKDEFLQMLREQVQTGNRLLSEGLNAQPTAEQFILDYEDWNDSNHELFKNTLHHLDSPIHDLFFQVQALYGENLRARKNVKNTGIANDHFKNEIDIARKALFHQIYLLNSYIDSIDRFFIDEELQQNISLFKEAQTIANLGAYSIDINTGNWTGSEELNRILGIDDSYEKTYEAGQAIIHPDFRSMMADYFTTEVIAKRKKWDVEYKIIRYNDKAERWVHGLGDLKVNEQNEPISLVATVQDITDRKNLELELTQAIEFNNSLIGTMQDGFAIVNAEGVHTLVNEAFCKMTGFGQDELIGTSAPFKYWPPEQLEQINNAFSKSLSENIYKFELIFMRKNGERFPVMIAPVPIKNKAGDIISFAASIQDITQIKEYQNQLIQNNMELEKAKNKAEESEMHYRTLVENAPEALFVFDLSSQKFISVSKSAIELFNFSENELLNMGVADISPLSQPDGTLSSEKAMQKIATAVEGKKPTFEWTHQNKEGKLIPCEVTLVRLPSVDKILIRGSVTDISERKNAEEELKLSNERHRAILNNIDAGVVIHAPDTSIIHCNHKAIKSLGLTEDQIFGKKAIDPDWQFLDEHNHPMPWEKYPVNQVLSIKKPIRNIIVGVQRPIQKDILWALVNGFPVLNQEGEIIEVVISFIDITEHRRLELDINERIAFEIELQAAKEKAEESEKLKTAFLQNMSHEIRTPLNAISGFIQMLDKPDLSPEKRKSYSSIIVNSSNQLLGLVSDLLTISSIETNQEKINLSEVNINSIIVDLLSIFKLQASNQNVFLYSKQNLPDKQAEIFSDKMKLTQILTNLLSNAMKFTHTGSIEFGYNLRDTMLEFYVKDTGIGIAANQQEKIFGRFQQATNLNSVQYGGTGLGLAISKAFVELLGGRIRVESIPEQGSTFYFTIPYKPVHANDEQALANNGVQQPGITILIAEDVEINFLLLEELFNSMGCRTLHAKNGQIAVDMCASDPSIDLVFMDIKMPILDGYAAATLIKKDRPNLPIIAQSGYAFDDEKEKYKSVFNEYISKPFDIEDLENLARKYFDQIHQKR